MKNDSLEMPAGEEGVVIAAQRLQPSHAHDATSRRRRLKKDIDKYEKEIERPKAIAIFKQMVGEINEVTGTQMVDPGTRQKVGASEIAEVILEQIEGFAVEWIKGTKEAREQAREHVQPVLAARASGAEGKIAAHGAHEARRRAAFGRA